MKNLIASSYSRWDNGAYAHYLEAFSLSPDQTISSLSRGMKMKFSLALALSHHAELLIMDEPTSGLDPRMRKQFIEILKEFMAQGGKAVFYSTHHTSDLDKVADVLVMIDNGKILAAAGLEQNQLMPLYDGLKRELTRLSTDYHWEGKAVNERMDAAAGLR